MHGHNRIQMKVGGPSSGRGAAGGYSWRAVVYRLLQIYGYCFLS